MKARCLDNDQYEVSLEKGKLYEVIPDATLEALGELCIIDESGESYIFPAWRFVIVETPM